MNSEYNSRETVANKRIICNFAASFHLEFSFDWLHEIQKGSVE